MFFSLISILLFKNPLLKKLVDNIAKFVGDNKLDGVDLDLECWWPAEGSKAADQGGNSGSPHVLFFFSFNAFYPFLSFFFFLLY